MIRTLFLFAAVLGLAACNTSDAPAATAEDTPVVMTSTGPVATVYKSPTCGCCSLWNRHLEENGFQVVAYDRDDMNAVKDSLGVTPELASCHTAVIEGYVVEGHVPAASIQRLLEERPDARGLSVPGMPLGSPGMEQGDIKQSYDVLLVGNNGEATVFDHIEGNDAG
ncbi:MAG: DUF411 domain-containing protein [Bacteroidota bacterium]